MRWEDLKNSLDRLSPRERIMVGGAIGAFVLIMMLLVGYFILSRLDELEMNNQAMREAIIRLEKNKDCYIEARQRIARLEARMSHGSLELNRLIETAASAVGISISESDEITPVTLDKFTQRGVEIKLRKVNIAQLASLMKELEANPQIVQITRLSVNTRWSQHNELDIEMIVSTYERKQSSPKGTSNSRRKKSS